MPRDTRRRFEAEIARLAPTVRAAFLQAVADIKRSSDPTKLASAIASGDFQSVLSVVNLGPEYFAPLDEAVRAAHKAGGEYLVSSLPAKNPGTGAQLVVRFQGSHPRAEQWVAQKSSELITEIVTDQRVLIRDAISRGIAQGHNPKKTALELVGRVVDGRRQGGIVGLTSRDVQALERYKFKLSSEGRKQDQIDRMADKYFNKLLRRRGETIARTETTAALNAGREEGVAQLIDRGDVKSDYVTGEWQAAGDERVRDSHGEMHGQTRLRGEPFDSPTGGQMMFPGDPSLGARGADTINCRCYKSISIDWLASAVYDD